MSMEDKQSNWSGESYTAAVGAAATTGLGKGLTAKGALPNAARKDETSGTSAASPSGNSDFDEAWRRAKSKLKAIVGEDVYSSWFMSTEFEHFDGAVLNVSAPTKFLKNWVQNHYSKVLLDSCKSEFKGLERVNVMLRQPGNAAQKQASAQATANQGFSEVAPQTNSMKPLFGQPVRTRQPAGAGTAQHGSPGPFDGSPLDARFTFENFVIGAANRLAHAAAKQIAETVLEQPLRFNPLYIHSSVGLGKTHLLHAIAWDVKRRHPNASVLYLTAERFRYHFVGAVMAQDPMTFKDKFRSVDLLLIDDLEFMQGPKTEEEFDHTLNMLLMAAGRWSWPRRALPCIWRASMRACGRGSPAAW